MSDTVKLIIEIPKPMYESVQNGTYCGTLYEELKNGVPLDDVKAKIHEKVADYVARGYADSAEDFEEYSRIVNQTFDNIGKAESEVTE